MKIRMMWKSFLKTTIQSKKKVFFFEKKCILGIEQNCQKLYIINHATGSSAAGSASGLGPGCRRFKSCLPDFVSPCIIRTYFF